MNLLTMLPIPATHRAAIRVTKDAVRQIRGGHPWVFESSIRSVSRDPSAGDLAVVFDDRREFVAIGLWDPTSPIRLRVLHTGKPVPIDDSFWRARTDAAVDRRRALLDRGDTTGLRLIHGENDGLPGLVVDVYDTTAVVKLYTTAWLAHLRNVLPAVLATEGTASLSIDRVVLRASRNVQRSTPHMLTSGVTVLGEEPSAPIVFLEQGLRFEADVVGGQKTGHFLDQRDNRTEIGRRARDRRVLDVFACTGGFSVHAAAGGAVDVTSVDLSRRSLATAEANMAHNRNRRAVAGARHRTMVGDAFEVMGELRRRGNSYDVVVVDPPSFAQRARDHRVALDAYQRLAELGLSLVEPGGTYLQSSCSARVDAAQLREAVAAGARSAGVELANRVETGHPIDHPIGFAYGGYLTSLFATVH
ncbi:MAG TPA: class I SAM-dependent rRNA methyltransferase [Microthrixaceae bacterium]|nr:class I SAM-dependent rRNA methyltransferase [Microthrixaceae bacterium]